MPFLRRVTAGRPVPQDRLDEVAARYLELGGSSPIVAQTEALLAALVERLAARGLEVPAYLGQDVYKKQPGCCFPPPPKAPSPWNAGRPIPSPTTSQCSTTRAPGLK